MIKYLIILANLTTVFGFFGKRKDELKWDVTYTPKKCKNTVEYGDQAFIFYKAYKKLKGEDGYEADFFDRSFHDKPYRFPVGMEYVIRGLDEGIIGMCVGEKRTLYIPDHMAYGMEGSEGGGTKETPGGALKFEVEVYEVEPGHRSPAVFKDMDLNADRYLNKDEVRKYLKLAFYQRHPNASEVDFQSANQEEWVEYIFKDEDSNKDGWISFREFVGPYHKEL